MGTRTTLNRALSKLGLCSRTDAIKLIQEGKIVVNNKRATTHLMWIDTTKDNIILRTSNISEENTKKPIIHSEPKLYLAMYKPKGYITTKSDEYGRKTVYNLLPKQYHNTWIFPVGRLDKDSEGLLLLTNDGEWQNDILDPQSHLKKTYNVWVTKHLTPEKIKKLERGIILGSYQLEPCTINTEQDHYTITISEGKNRQVRKMMEYVGTEVTKLERIKIGKLTLNETGLKPGETIEIDPNILF